MALGPAGSRLDGPRRLVPLKAPKPGRPGSKPEARLLALLERDEATRGLFAPQGAVGRWPGGQSMKVDLLCSSLKLALEVDGRWHMLPEQRRRDQRKDQTLQQRGYLVIRLLAEDVESPKALERVREAIRSRGQNARRS